MLLLKPLRPVEGTVAIQMLDGRLVGWITDDTNIWLHSPTAISTSIEHPSQTALNLSRNLESVCHAIVIQKMGFGVTSPDSRIESRSPIGSQQ